PSRFKQAKTWKLHNYKHPFIVDKAPVRNAAKGMLPDSLVHKKKWGFGVKAHQALTVKPGFFTDGYVSEICGLNKKGEQYMLEEMIPYHVGKLVSVEVFGKLFGHGQSIETINEHLLNYVSMN
ncbi:MAG: hypothetical protein ACREA9_25100, partial [Pyrinomonadaceae bacterium]